jgi:hypothetical protein
MDLELGYQELCDQVKKWLVIAGNVSVYPGPNLLWYSMNDEATILCEAKWSPDLYHLHTEGDPFAFAVKDLMAGLKLCPPSNRDTVVHWQAQEKQSQLWYMDHENEMLITLPHIDHLTPILSPCFAPRFPVLVAESLWRQWFQHADVYDQVEFRIDPMATNTTGRFCIKFTKDSHDIEVAKTPSTSQQISRLVNRGTLGVRLETDMTESMSLYSVPARITALLPVIDRNFRIFFDIDHPLCIRVDGPVIMTLFISPSTFQPSDDLFLQQAMQHLGI